MRQQEHAQQESDFQGNRHILAITKAKRRKRIASSFENYRVKSEKSNKYVMDGLSSLFLVIQ